LLPLLLELVLVEAHLVLVHVPHFFEALVSLGVTHHPKRLVVLAERGGKVRLRLFIPSEAFGHARCVLGLVKTWHLSRITRKHLDELLISSNFWFRRHARWWDHLETFLVVLIFSSLALSLPSALVLLGVIVFVAWKPERLGLMLLAWLHLTGHLSLIGHVLHLSILVIVLGLVHGTRLGLQLVRLLLVLLLLGVFIALGLEGLVIKVETAHLILKFIAKRVLLSCAGILLVLFFELLKNIQIDMGLVGRFWQSRVPWLQGVIIIVVLLGGVNYILLFLFVVVLSILGLVLVQLLLGEHLLLYRYIFALGHPSLVKTRTSPQELTDHVWILLAPVGA